MPGTFRPALASLETVLIEKKRRTVRFYLSEAGRFAGRIAGTGNLGADPVEEAQQGLGRGSIFRPG